MALCCAKPSILNRGSRILSFIAFSEGDCASRITAGTFWFPPSRSGVTWAAHKESTLASTRIVARRITCSVWHGNAQKQEENSKKLAETCFPGPFNHVFTKKFLSLNRLVSIVVRANPPTTYLQT